MNETKAPEGEFHEPWIVDPDSVGEINSSDYLISVQVYQVYANDREDNHRFRRAVAQRIVDCVNACTGTNPAAAVAGEPDEQLIRERDEAEEALSEAYRAVTGREPEWSNAFGYADALEEIKDAAAVAGEMVDALKKCAAVCAGETLNKNALTDALLAARKALAKARPQEQTNSPK